MSYESDGPDQTPERPPSSAADRRGDDGWGTDSADGSTRASTDGHDVAAAEGRDRLGTGRPPIDGWGEDADREARVSTAQAVAKAEAVGIAVAQARFEERVDAELGARRESPVEVPLPIAGDAIAERTTHNRINLADNVPNVRHQAEYGGYLDVVMHGDADGTQSYVDRRRTDFSFEETCQLIENSPVWDGRPIRLMSCSTGAGDYARRLANRLGSPVYAPDGILRVDADGTKLVLDHPDGTPGGWRRFEPEQA